MIGKRWKKYAQDCPSRLQAQYGELLTLLRLTKNVEACTCSPGMEKLFKKHVNSNFRTITQVFPECVARVPVSLGGLGVRLCSPSFAFAVATVRKCSQPSATVRVSAVRLSTVASVSGVVPKACQVELWRRSYIGVCSGGVCGTDLCRRSYIMLYWCLQRRCLCE